LECFFMRGKSEEGAQAACRRAKEGSDAEGIDEDVQTDVLITAHGTVGNETAGITRGRRRAEGITVAMRFTGSCFSRAGAGVGLELSA
jgi:hypothetical protein